MCTYPPELLESPFVTPFVFTVLAKHRMELGANWIHGVLGNPLYEIATANGLIDIVHVPKPHKVVAATEEGKQVPFQLLQV